MHYVFFESEPPHTTIFAAMIVEREDVIAFLEDDNNWPILPATSESKHALAPVQAQVIVIYKKKLLVDCVFSQQVLPKMDEHRPPSKSTIDAIACPTVGGPEWERLWVMLWLASLLGEAPMDMLQDVEELTIEAKRGPQGIVRLRKVFRHD